MRGIQPCNLATEEGLHQLVEEYAVNYLDRMVHIDQLLSARDNAIVFKYEDFFNDYELVLDNIQEKTGYIISREQRDNMKENVSFHKMKKETDKDKNGKLIKDRYAGDIYLIEKYELWGGHISNKPHPGKWKEVIPEKYQSFYNDKLSKYTELLGYDV
jgi:hypothetical protein